MPRRLKWRQVFYHPIRHLRLSVYIEDSWGPKKYSENIPMSFPHCPIQSESQLLKKNLFQNANYKKKVFAENYKLAKINYQMAISFFLLIYLSSVFST